MLFRSFNIVSNQEIQTTERNRGNVSKSTGLTYNATTGVFLITNTGVTAGDYGGNVAQETIMSMHKDRLLVQIQLQ